MMLLGIACAGGIGAALRYLVDNALPQRIRQRLPWGTFVVNLSGSFLLGLVVGAQSARLPEAWATMLGTGLLGGYTTFSTASLETVQLLHQRRYAAATLNGLGMVVAGVVLAYAGLMLGAL